MNLMDLPQSILNGSVACFFSASDAQSFARTCTRALEDLQKTLKLLRCKRKNFEVYEAWPERWKQPPDCEESEDEEDEEDDEDEEEEWSQEKKKGQEIDVFGNLLY
jgi:TATA-binding protein-associated factor Taf7